MPTKATTHSAKAQGTRGRKPEKARDNGGAQRKRGIKKNGAPSGSNEIRTTGKGLGVSNHQEAANGEAGNTNEARAHGEPRSRRPAKQATHSAKAQGTRGRKPEKARDKGDAQKKARK